MFPRDHRAQASVPARRGENDMKVWTKLAAALAIAVMTSAAVPAMAADDKPAPAEKAAKKAGLRGSVVKVDGTKLVISTGKKAEAKEVTIETSDKTVIMVEGQAAKLADLKPGQKVVITPETGTAEKIDVPAAKAKKAK
jgi:hypothetical protein